MSKLASCIFPIYNPYMLLFLPDYFAHYEVIFGKLNFSSLFDPPGGKNKPDIGRPICFGTCKLGPCVQIGICPAPCVLCLLTVVFA